MIAQDDHLTAGAWAACAWPRRTRQRNIIWYNPPFSNNLQTNIGKTFLRLVLKHFPKHHKYHSLFIKNNVKVSYSCMENMGSIINKHNKKVISNNTLYIIPLLYEIINERFRRGIHVLKLTKNTAVLSKWESANINFNCFVNKGVNHRHLKSRPGIPCDSPRFIFQFSQAAVNQFLG